MKKSLFTKVLSFFMVTGALLLGTVSNNAVEKTNNDIKFETVDDLGRGSFNLKSKNTVIGDAEVTAVSDTRAQYGLDADGNYRIRFVTALTGDVHTLSYTLFKDGVEYGSYYVTTIYKSVMSGESTLYYDGTDFVTEATEATNDYYFACGSIVVGPSYYATKFTASLTLTKSDETIVTSTPREASVNDLVNYQFADKCVADFETKNQISGFTAPWGSTISYSEDIKASGNGAMKMTLHNQFSIMDINGEGLGVDSLENYDGFNLKFYVSDTTETNVYSDTTFFRFVLVYKDEASTSVSTVDVKETNTWVDVYLPLKDYNQYNLKDGKFQFSFAKYVNNTVTATGGYEGVEVYIDEIYMEPIYVAGDTILNIPYSNIYTNVSASETGIIEAGTTAKYGVGHGTYENYSLYNSSDLGTTKSNEVSGITSTYFYLPPNTDNVITFIEANEFCLAKFTINESNFGVWIAATITIRKYTASTDSWSVVLTGSGSSTEALLPFMSCDYQELQAGDKLVMEIQNTAGSWRYINNPSGIAIASAKEYVAPPKTIEDAKTRLLSEEYTFDANANIYSLTNGGTDDHMSIGLLNDTTSFAVAPTTSNGWCGFQGSDTSIQVNFQADKEPHTFYYAYTATESGYIYIDQIVSNWYTGTALMTVTVGEETIVSTEFDHADGLKFDLDTAAYLEAGETIKVQFKNVTTPSGSRFVFNKLNIAFVGCLEMEIPAGYDSLVDYINA